MAEEIKYGTYEDALQACDKIMTPKVCQGNSTTTILELAAKMNQDQSNFVILPTTRVS